MQNANKTRGTGPLGGAGLVGLWGASSMVRSVQYFVSTVNGATVNITIAAVNPANAVVMPMFLKSTETGGNLGVSCATVEITTATNVAVKRLNWVGETARFMVLEFAPGVLKSNQVANLSQGSTGLTTTTATITAVNTNKIMLVCSDRNTASTQGPDKVKSDVEVTNATTLTSTRTTADATYYNVNTVQVLEFF